MNKYLIEGSGAFGQEISINEKSKACTLTPDHTFILLGWNVLIPIRLLFQA